MRERPIVPSAARAARIVLAAAFPPLAALHAQAHEHGAQRNTAGAEDAMSAAMHEQMAGHIANGAHMRMTPLRPGRTADSERAAAVERALLPVLRHYRNVRTAEADGYEMFAPQLKQQRVFHFTRRSHALRNAFGFDAARPTSLLYTKDAAGDFHLVGAMYTAPHRATLDDLDERVPLSVAQWHEHVAICVPRAADAPRWREMQDGRMRFGPAGAIATEQACRAANGVWHDRIFGWMVHANLVQTPDGERISWADEH